MWLDDRLNLNHPHSNMTKPQAYVKKKKSRFEKKVYMNRETIGEGILNICSLN